MKLIHYGSPKFLPSRFKPVENDDRWGVNKPKQGGLWTYRIESNWGWKDWNGEESFTVRLKPESKVVFIDSYEDLHNAILVRKHLDFELIAKHYDAIWLTEKGQHETHLSSPLNLYGWDCETVLLLNAECFVEL